MRKILLATSALVAFAGAAQAAESPITVTAGGYVDFRGALMHESQNTSTSGVRRGGDFATEYGLNFAAEGKAAGGIQYGAMISLDNKANLGENAPADQVKMDQGYVWMSGAFGKVLMGDEHGASDLFVIAPTVGEGQIDGSYTYFTDMNTLAQFQPTFIDATENATKFTYYTPKVGNADHKVQLGISYTPDANSMGNDVTKYVANMEKDYRDMIETSMQYTGKFAPVSVVVSPMAAFGDGVNNAKDATVLGLGAQAMYAGFTVGGSYVDAGNYGMNKNMDNMGGKDKNQNVWTGGVKYEFDKVAVAANYMDGEGYAPIAGTTTYLDDFSAVGVGATYTWFPGMTSSADAVFFTQDPAGNTDNNVGHVLMLSQKMAF